MLGHFLKTTAGKLIVLAVIAILYVHFIRYIVKEKLDLVAAPNQRLFGILPRDQEKPFRRTY